MGNGKSTSKKKYAASAPPAVGRRNSSRVAPELADLAEEDEDGGPLDSRLSAARSPRGSQAYSSEDFRRSTLGPMQSDVDSSSLRWHSNHCVGTDLGRAMTIREAFDFDDSKKKEVSKKERVWSMGDGVRRDYGTIKVSRLYPPRVNCDVCGTFIVDRQGERAFYFCWRCRRAGRSFHICEACYDQGSLGTTPRSRGRPSRRMGHSVSDGGRLTPHGSTRRNSKESSNSFSRRPSRESSRSVSLGTSGDIASRVPSKASVNAVATMDKAIPSGTWKGTFEEGGNRRPAKRELSFVASGLIVGSGADGCSLEGFFNNRSGGLYNVEWTETYEWGRIEVTAWLSLAPRQDAHIDGQFFASDGGKGRLDLRYS